ncbi:rab11-2 [Sarcoptes scabiei]|nr:rab11-2 [Sarcoptes scabiei]
MGRPRSKSRSRSNSSNTDGSNSNQSSLNRKNPSSSSPYSSQKSYSSSSKSSSRHRSDSFKKNSTQSKSSTSQCQSNKSSSASNGSQSSSSPCSSSRSSSKSSKMSASLIGQSQKPPSLPDKPNLLDKLAMIEQCEPWIELFSVEEMKERGYIIDSFIVADDCYQFFSARKNQNMILCKMIEMKKCSPRYQKNMIAYSLKIARFLGGAEDLGGVPASEYFIKIFEIFKINNDVFMFMEECPNKSLYLILLDRDDFSPDDERRWTMQIVKAVEKMQAYGIAHRFLKLQHILFDARKNIKIAGWSKSVSFWDVDQNCALLQNKERKSRKNSHLPPECFRSVYDPSKIDMWSVGVLMVCLNTGCYPFNIKSMSKFSAQWRQFVLKHQMNRFVRAACNKTFYIDPNQRARPTEFLEHPYFCASSEEIRLKQFKTTLDPKYDPNMPMEKTLSITSVGLGSSTNESTSTSASSSSSSTCYSGGSSSQGSSSVSATSASVSSESVGSLKKTVGKKSPKKTSSCKTTDSDITNIIGTSTNNYEEGDDQASGVEGGKVGNEIPPEEIAYESKTQENMAPEEQADQAKPISYPSSSKKKSSH